MRPTIFLSGYDRGFYRLSLFCSSSIFFRNGIETYKRYIRKLKDGNFRFRMFSRQETNVLQRTLLPAKNMVGVLTHTHLLSDIFLHHNKIVFS